LALAVDALGAGFGAAVAGLKFLLVPLFVGIFKLIFVFLALNIFCKQSIRSFFLFFGGLFLHL